MLLSVLIVDFMFCVCLDICCVSIDCLVWLFGLVCVDSYFLVFAVVCFGFDLFLWLVCCKCLLCLFSVILDGCYICIV